MRPSLSLPLCALLGLVLAGCVKMVESSPGALSSESGGLGCRTSLGAYYLPKAIINVSATADPASHVITFDETKFRANLIADRKAPYCLDYLAVATADDLITVQRTPDGLLQQVTSDATDRTPEIANKLIDTASNFVVATARSAQFGGPATPAKIDLDFDPLDPDDLARANRALRRFGLCVHVDGIGYSDDSPERWCANPRAPARDLPVFKGAVEPVAQEASRTEVLYRANRKYQVSLYKQVDPGHSPWRLHVTRGMEMPNLSPVFGIGVERTLFAQRKTTLKFTNGVLDDVTIDKGSEVLGFVSIPLYLSQAIVAIPANIIQLKINTTDQRTKLIDAQSKLIDAWSKYNKEAGAGAAAGGAGDAAGSGRSASVGAAGDYQRSAAYQNCLDAGTPAQCESLYRTGRLK